MKKKSFMLAAAALAGMVLLSACSAPQTTGNAGGNDSGTAGTQSAGQGAGSTGSNENTSGQGTGSSGADAGSADTNTEVGSAGAAAGNAAQAGSSEGNSAQEQDVENGLEDIPEIDPNVGDVGSQSSAGSDTSSQDIWSGTYVSQSETLSITYLDEQSLSFAFGQSGISGTAQLSGAQAVYKGDDHHDVVFNISGDTVTVSVASEEDYDASESPLNGTYVKEA